MAKTKPSKEDLEAGSQARNAARTRELAEKRVAADRERAERERKSA